MIGVGATARLYPVNLPQGYVTTQGSAAVYEIISTVDEHTLSDRSGLVQSRVQVSTYAATHNAAITLAREIKNCGVTTLKGVSSSVDFRGISVESGIRCYNEQPNDGTDSWRFIAEFDFIISYLEGTT